MQFKNIITCIDAHAGGEPLRIVTSGLPSIHVSTMLEKRSYFLLNLNHFRKLIIHEPRGHKNMYGAVITPPVSDGGDIGVLFIDNEGVSTMCGHGLIALSKVVYEAGLIKPVEGVNVLTMDAPAGTVTAYVECYDGRVESAWVHHVPSFTYKSDHNIYLDGIGEISVDICFGGVFYVFVRDCDLGLEIVPENISILVERGMQIKKIVSDSLEVVHPTEPGINWIFGTIIIKPAVVVGNRIRARNVCVYGDGGVDRSPCGTGTAARMAQLYSRGILRPDMIFENHSIIDTVFKGEIVNETTIGRVPGIVPKLSGSAYIMGFNNLVLEPDDPMPEGFRLY